MLILLKNEKEEKRKRKCGSIFFLVLDSYTLKQVKVLFV